MPRRTNSSTILSETLSSQANSLRPMYDGGRLALARLLALVRTLEGVTSLPSLALRNCCFVIPLDHNPWFYRAARLFGEGSKSPPEAAEAASEVNSAPHSPAFDSGCKS